MKINSNFRDYYDSVIAYGVDPNIHYNRFRYEVDGWDHKFFKEARFHSEQRMSKYSIILIYIGFCGKLYVMGKPSIDLLAQKDYPHTYLEEAPWMATPGGKI